MSISGLGRDGRKYERIRQEAYRMGTMVQTEMRPLAEYRYYNDLTLQGDRLTVNGTDIICGAFKQLYADLWGSAYTDALRDILKSELENTSMISESFGPGFYGMDIREVAKLGQLLDFEGKRISVKNGHMMVPQKSCTGIVFKVNNNYRKIDAACESCQGNHLNCSMRIINRSR